VSALTYVLAVIVGLAAGVTGVIAMLGVGMTWRLPALLPLGGVSLVLDPGRRISGDDWLGRTAGVALRPR